MAIFALICMTLLVALDQILKYWAVANLREGTIALIPGFLHLTYVENYGAAFGIFQQKTFLLVGVTSLLLIAGVWLLFSGKIKNKLLVVCTVLILSGGIGNLIDRITRGFVVDYLDINSWLRFPMFNLADCCVVVGTFLLILYILFFEKKALDAPKAANLTEQEQQ